jgi:twinkle protein
MPIHFSDHAKMELRQWARGQSIGQHRRTCPDCSPGRTKKNDECLSCSIDVEKVLANCRHCGASGRINLEEKVLRPNFNRPAVRVPFNPPSVSSGKPAGASKAIRDIGTGLDAGTRLWIKGRGISEDVATKYGLVHARAYFTRIKKEGPGIAYPYWVNTGVAGHKVRSTEEKDHVCDKGLYSLFGIQHVNLETESQIVFCEGEPDALSMAEAGVNNPVSVPNGASSFGNSMPNGDDPKAQYGFLWTAKEQIDAAKKIIIATDMDEPGDSLADELARRIGKHRCWRVRFPEGCKDANDTLLKHGKEVLVKCVKEAEPWPVAGLYEADRYFQAVDDLYDFGFAKKVTTGYAEVDDIYSLSPGSLTIVTGLPNAGKTTFINQLMVNAARIHGYVSLICSFETPPSVHIPVLAEMLLQVPFFKPNAYGERMKKDDLKKTYAFISRHFKFMQQDEGAKASIADLIERIKIAVFRWGIRCVVIDPYSYIHRPSDISETQFIEQILSDVRLLAQAYGLHIWFIAHTTKMVQNMDGSYKVPGGFDISGSAGWFARADHGITIHQDHEFPSTVRIVSWKSRFDWLGKKGEVSMTWDNEYRRYLTKMFDEMEPYNADEDMRADAR